MPDPKRGGAPVHEVEKGREISPQEAIESTREALHELTVLEGELYRASQKPGSHTDLLSKYDAAKCRLMVQKDELLRHKDAIHVEENEGQILEYSELVFADGGVLDMLHTPAFVLRMQGWEDTTVSIEQWGWSVRNDKKSAAMAQFMSLSDQGYALSMPRGGTSEYFLKRKYE